MDTALKLAADLYHFFRVSAFGATATLPLLGAASVSPHLTARKAGGLLAVAAAFHAFAYVHNDVCDLPIDRTQPQRAMYPLVRGEISPRAALALAVACVPLAFALDALLLGTTDDGTTARQSSPKSELAEVRRGASASARPPSAWLNKLAQPAMPGLPWSVADRRVHLAAAFALLATYNRWGKRCAIPPLTDVLQGLGWVALLRYGAVAAGPAPTRLTELLSAYELLLIVMVNGIHGALRDLENDAAHGAHTTAILFGARAEQGGGLRVSPALVTYAMALQTALLALPGWGAAANLAGHDAREWAAATVGVGAVGAGTLAVLALGARDGATAEPGMAHLVLLLSAPVAMVAPGLRPPARAALLAAHLLPLLPNGLTYATLRWLAGGKSAADPLPRGNSSMV